MERTASALSLDASGWRSLAWAAAGALFAVALPLLLITSNVRLIINSSALYEWDFNRYEIESRTGLSREELRSAAAQIRSYFNNDEALLNVRVRFAEEPVRDRRQDQIGPIARGDQKRVRGKLPKGVLRTRDAQDHLPHAVLHLLLAVEDLSSCGGQHLPDRR